VKSHYLAMIHNEVPNINRCLWKLKAPLRVKIFLWYLQRGVILTKDNLIMRNWQGSRQCVFCHKDETIQHLFFECRLAHMVWAVTYAASGIPQPCSVSNMFGQWLMGLSNELKPLILLDATSTCWSLWMCRNALIFENKQTSFLQVIFTILRWLRTWAILQKPTTQGLVTAASQQLALMAKVFFTQAYG
jgi:hypothetical protein